MKPLQGQKALVAGGDSGIGAALVSALTLEQRRTVLYTNLTGAFLCAREAVKLFLAQDRTYIDASVNSSSEWP